MGGEMMLPDAILTVATLCEFRIREWSEACSRPAQRPLSSHLGSTCRLSWQRGAGEEGQCWRLPGAKAGVDHEQPPFTLSRATFAVGSLCE